MKKPFLITFLCASLILVTPFTGVAQENKVSNTLTEHPDIDGLVAQIRVVINEILQKYGHIPIVNNLLQSIISLLLLFARITLCIFLIIIGIPIVILFFILFFLGMSPDYLLFYVTLIFSTLDDFCLTYRPFISKLQLQSIVTQLETDNITYSAKNCPCLQE